MSVAVPFPNLFFCFMFFVSRLCSLLRPLTVGFLFVHYIQIKYHFSTANTKIYISNLDLAPEFPVLIQLLTLHFFLDIQSF